MIRRKSCKREQKWFKTCKDLDLFYLSADRVHIFKLYLAAITIRSLHWKNSMTARLPSRWRCIAGEKVVTEYEYSLIARCWWQRLPSPGNVKPTYFVSRNKCSHCSHKVSLPYTSHSSGSSTEGQSLYPITWKSWIWPFVVTNCCITTLPNLPMLVTYLSCSSYR